MIPADEKTLGKRDRREHSVDSIRIGGCIYDINTMKRLGTCVEKRERDPSNKATVLFFISYFLVFLCGAICNHFLAKVFA